MKTFQIDFIRAVFDWKLEQFTNNSDYFNNEDIFIYSFYEHLLSESAVNRYVETYKELVSAQNRQHKIGIGMVAISDTPTITNLRDTFVCPFEWTCKIRTTLGNRDKMYGTFNAIIEDLKGNKVDIALLDTFDDNGEKIEYILPIKTFAYGYTNGSYIGLFNTYPSSNDIVARINELNAKWGITSQLFTFNDRVYFEYDNKVYCFYYSEQTLTFVRDNDILPEHETFRKLKVSFGFDSIVCDQPYNLNANEYCEITFGGSATLCDYSVRLGNDMIDTKIGKVKIVTSDNGQDIDLRVNGNVKYYDIEPLDMGNSTDINSTVNQLRSNLMLANSLADSITNSIDYTFVCDLSIPLLKQWFNFSRYYDQNRDSNGNITTDSITPNIIYSIKEYYSTFGEVEVKELLGKIVGKIDIGNTESDLMTLAISFQVQGENN